MLVVKRGHGIGRCNLAGGSGCWRDFGEAEVQNFGVTPLGDKEVGGLDVAMDNALGVCGVEAVGDFDGEGEDRLVI